MTDQDRLLFCKKCTNRKMDLKQGILCGLSDRKPDFVGECSTYNLDENVKIVEESTVNEDGKIQLKLTDKELDKLRSEQNYQLALIVGIIVGLVGAGIWAAITVSTGYQIGYLALAIGAGVGFSMRMFGKGIDQIFGITGAIIALVSCILGNVFSIIAIFADYQGVSFFDMLAQFDYSQLLPIMQESFSPIDLLFYGIAAYEGYKFAFRTLTQEELEEL